MISAQVDNAALGGPAASVRVDVLSPCGRRVAATSRRVYSVEMSRGDAAVATWIFSGDESRRRRGRDADIQRRRHSYVYQRIDPKLPKYSLNVGYEAAVHIRFIVEHYDVLPNVTRRVW